MDTQELNDLLGEKIIEAIKDENMPMDRKLSRVEYLYKRGANLEVKDSDGRTALMSASEYNHKEVTEFLIENGADVNVKDKDGWTTLMWASCKGHKEVVELLEKAREESKAKLKEELKDDSKSLNSNKDEKKNNKSVILGKMFGGNDGM